MVDPAAVRHRSYCKRGNPVASVVGFGKPTTPSTLLRHTFIRMFRQSPYDKARPMSSHHACHFVLLFGLLTLFGCKSDDLPATVNVEGTVTLDGEPVEGASVVFIAQAGANNATGVTDGSGRFSMDSFPGRKKGAVPDSYNVEIAKTIVEDKGERDGEGMVQLSYGLPKQYASQLTSGLSVNVGSDVTDLKFELTSAAK